MTGAVLLLSLATHPHFTLRTGSLLSRAPLMVHVGAGMVGIVTGYVALSVRKGGAVHRQWGMWFVYAMLTMALVGATLAGIEWKWGSVDGGLLTAYLVATAVTTVRSRTQALRRFDVGASLVAVAVAIANVAMGSQAVLHGAHSVDGVPVAMFYVFACIALASVAGDVRLLRAGELRGTPRLVRHLWRMCFGLFIAAGSFFIGQAHLFPKALRIYPLLAIPMVLPLLLIPYWMLRLRRKRTSGLRAIVQLREPPALGATA